jgi:hypothetical protein
MSDRVLTKQKSQSTVQERSQTSVSAEIDKVSLYWNCWIVGRCLSCERNVPGRWTTSAHWRLV